MGASKYVKEVVAEGRRVRWPKRDQVLPVFGIVLLIIAIAGILLLIFDVGANRLLDMIREAFQSLN